MNENGMTSGRTDRHLLAAAAVAGVAALACGAEIVAALGSRVGTWGFRTGFKILQYGGYLAVLAAIAATVVFFTSARAKKWSAVALSLVVCAVATTGAAIPLSWKMTAKKVPPIHDITTDMANPPEFSAILPLRRDAPNSTVYGGTETALRQREAYPDIRPVVLEMGVSQAFHIAEQAVQKLGWEVVQVSPEKGIIEAVDTTFWFGFKDDIVIRVTPAGADRSVVDIRSTSRVGVSDVGTNARRIRKFIAFIGG